MKRFVLFGLLSVAVLWAGNAPAQLTARQRGCKITYLKSAGQHVRCLFDARAKAVRGGGAADYTRCEHDFLASHKLAASYFGADACKVAETTDQNVTGETSLWLGYSPRFVDNKDGTITDNATGLMWEVKNKTNWADKYRWAGECSVSGDLCQPSEKEVDLCPKGNVGCSVCPHPENGDTCQVAGNDTAFSWISSLNDANFAGHKDWRLPGVGELQTIVAEPYPGSTLPNIGPIFGPTQQDHYWSLTTAAGYPDGAWNVHFNGGYANVDDKVSGAYVRAVRGGY